MDLNTTDWHVHCAVNAANPIARFGILVILNIRQKMERTEFKKAGKPSLYSPTP
jgi:hypothetical protein